ncbi:MAG TPA: type VI secretion system baseplate subunit TssG [Burkholderiaceae bacterium]|jgi:type VI secretion system protein ImpH|nr:type VI secretion system baseplate subunit TssG [Burkholderiaceae bacterium]
MRNAADSVELLEPTLLEPNSPEPTFLERVAARPYAFDFFYVLRRLEAGNPKRPRLGVAARPADEPIRLGQEPLLDFAPAALSGVRPARGARPPVIEVRFLGLLGPNGPLPLHLTEYARDRLLHHGDATFARFLDLINHRFLMLFYRAWAQAQPVANLDRRDDDRFTKYVGALFGSGLQSTRQRDAVEDEVKLHHAGTLARQVRNADGLRAMLSHYFKLPVRVEEFVAHWMRLPVDDRTRLGAGNESVQLGHGAVLGAAMWDAQSSIRLHIDAPTLADYEDFLPGGTLAERLIALLRTYLGWELRWNVRLSLAGIEVPPTKIGRQGRLGWTTWLSGGPREKDARDLVLDYEARLVASI